MAFFKESAPDTIDLTDLQKRGILKKSKPSNDFVELAPKTSDSGSSPFSFLDSLAGAASKSSEQTPPEFANIKVQLDNFEYKLEQFLERLTQVETKIKNFEDKVST